MLPNEATTRSEVITIPGELEALVAAPGRQDGRPIVAFLKQEKLNVTLVGDTDCAFEEALLHRPNIIFIHDDLPPAGGIDLCNRLKANTRTFFLPAVLIASEDSRPQRIRALAAGADAVFAPGMDEQERRTRLWSLLRSQTLYRRQEQKRQSQGVVIKQQGRWLGNFVHDLQNAVGALQANFEFLGQHAGIQPDARGDDVRDCLRESRAVLQQLTRGLRTVQDYERFQSGRVVLREQPLDLYELLVEVKEELDFNQPGQVRSIQLPDRQLPDRQLPDNQLPDRHGSWPLVGDRDLLRQAVTALATYLLRQPRTTTLQFGLRATEDGMQLTLASDGEPFDDDDRQRVFEPYTRVPRRASLAYGLGLAVARAIIDLHAGSVHVAQPGEPGLGSSQAAFVVKLKSRDPLPNHPLGQ